MGTSVLWIGIFAWFLVSCLVGFLVAQSFKTLRLPTRWPKETVSCFAETKAKTSVTAISDFEKPSSRKPFGADDNHLISIFLIALTVRYLFLLFQGVGASLVPWGDDTDLHLIAVDWIHHGKYDNTWYSPGYPAFLVTVYKLLGPEPANVRIVQAIVGALCCTLCYFLGRHQFSSKIGKIGALVLALFPAHVYMSWRVMPEILLSACALLTVVIASRWKSQPTSLLSYSFGFVAGLCTLLGFHLLIFPMLILCWAVATLVRIDSMSRRFKTVCGFVVILGILTTSLVTPLMAKIAQRETASDTGAHLFSGQVERTWTASKNRPSKDYWSRFEKTFSPLTLSKVLKENTAARIAHSLSFGGFLVFSLLGLSRIYRHSQSVIARPSVAPILFLTLSLMFSVAAFGGSARYSVVLIPSWAPICGLGLLHAYSHVTQLISDRLPGFPAR